MDLFKHMKDLNAYTTELLKLSNSISTLGSKVKIGKYKLVETPSEIAAERLQLLLQKAIGAEHKEMAAIYSKIETTLKEVQTDLFKDAGTPEDSTDYTLKFGSKNK